MGAKPDLGEILLGIEGLALLRLAFSGDAEARRARIEEMRALLGNLTEQTELGSPLKGPEYQLIEGYAAWSKTYDQPLRLFSIEEPAMKSRLDPLPAGTLLDVACGTGRYSAYMAGRGHQVIGIDLSPDMLALARAKLPEAEFREGDMESLPFEDASVDTAICALALVHLKDIRRAIAEMARVLRPGGRLIISDVHPMPILLGWQAQFRTAEGDAGFMRIHPHLLSDYCEAAIAAGLAVLSCAEPRLTPASAITPAAEILPDANLAAWVGLPGVVVWEFQKV